MRLAPVPRAAAGAAAIAAAALVVAGCCPRNLKQDTPVDQGSAMPPDETPPAATPSVRPDILQHTLANGLKVYMVEDHSAPLVSFQVWFKVGSVNEHEAGPGESHGNTGLSHFFEHMMFRGTEKHPDFFDAVYSLGGKLNAFTWLDETVYWEKVPSQHLETVIAMEADRLEHMKVDFLNLEPEREVVKSERLLRTVNRAEGQAWEKLQARMFVEHPYHWKTIGWLSDLNAVTVEEAQAYHSVFYAPNNAYVIVAGDHEPKQTLAWIEQYYGHLPSRELPSAELPVEPPQTAERRDRVFKATDPQVVMWAWRAPAPKHPDFAALEVIDHVLTAGKSSRLQKKLVFAETPRVGRLYAYLFPMRDPYMYTWGANLMRGMTVHELEAAVDAEIADIAANGVSEAELKRAVAGLRSDIVRQNLSSQEKAEFIGFSLRATDDPYAGFDRLELYGTITSADVQRVAAELLKPQNRTWVPVVDPGRLARLVDAMVAASPALPAQIAGVAKAATQALLMDQELAVQAEDLRAEARAIGLLEQRAERASAAADDETKAAIATYLDENEQGLTKRRARLQAGEAALAEARAKIAADSEANRKELKGLSRARFDASRLPGGFLVNLAQHVLYPAASKDRDAAKALDPKLGHGDPAILPHRVAYHAALAWIFDVQGQDVMASFHRSRALKLGADVLASPPADEALADVARQAYAIAWDTQVKGAPAAGPVRTAPTGARQGVTR